MSVPYGQAYTTVQNGITYCTLMASIPCIRIPFFSSPDIELGILGYGIELGDENQFNNGRPSHTNHHKGHLRVYRPNKTGQG